MKRLLLSLALVGVSVSSAQAQSWVFQPSYYSHDPATNVRIGRQYASGPVFTRPQGDYIRAGYRYNRSTIQVKGMQWDNVNLFEGWYQVGSQY